MPPAVKWKPAAPGTGSAGAIACWAQPPEVTATALGCTTGGLSSPEAALRLARDGANRLRNGPRLSRLNVLLAQLRSPLLLVLLFAAIASAATGEFTDSAIVIAIVGATVGVSYSREYSARRAVEALQAKVRTTVQVTRDGAIAEIPVEAVVAGDVVHLSAGSLVPGDGVLIDATDLYVAEAMLTGESFPVAKSAGVLPADTPLPARTNCVFFGTNVRSGTARALIVRTAERTEFGAIAHRLALRPPETEFDRGIRHFGYLLTSAMLALVLGVFLLHVLSGREPVDTLLFAVALAVGLSPELLPAILSVNLARGAQQMARHGVLVRRLNAIENLGSMDVLCTDKTGTLTEGVVRLEGAWDANGIPSPRVLSQAAWNAAFETGVKTPLDDAIVQAARESAAGDAGGVTPAHVRKLAEIPFDFVRKRVSVIVLTDAGRADQQRPLDGGARLITKGAFERVLDACTQLPGGAPLDDESRQQLVARYQAWSERGIRVLAVATRQVPVADVYSRDDETGLVFDGFLTFVDRPRPDVARTVSTLRRLGVAVKLITGDNRHVACHVAAAVGLRADRVVGGRELLETADAALCRIAEEADIFAEVDPNQKEQIILALKRTGHVVGFLGDGVNDAPAMHAADASLSVDHAVDVAREAADFVLLDGDLDVIRRGIEAGRRTFANTLKYVLTTMSANLGNMISMAAASLFLPFLPLLPGQILLNNFLSDVPAVGLADDAVDEEMVVRPDRWRMAAITRFMLVFGLVSTAFDILTFGLLMFVVQASPGTFRTAWFVESLLTELAVALVVRTRRPFYRSRPGRLLVGSTLVVAILTMLLPFIPAASLLGFVPLELPLVFAILSITAAYVAAVEMVKRLEYRNA